MYNVWSRDLQGHRTNWLLPPMSFRYYKRQPYSMRFFNKRLVEKAVDSGRRSYAGPTRRDSIPYAALYIAPILIDTRLHSTRGQFFIRHECGACIRLRTNTSLIRMISRSAYGFSIFVITCLHTSDERVQTLYTSCIRIVSNPFSVLHT